MTCTKSHTKLATRLAALASLAFVSLLALSLSAGAATTRVAGIDYYGEAAPVGVLAVQGNSGDTIYIDVDQGGTPLASRLSYTLASGEEEGVFSLSIDGATAANDIHLRAYASRTGSDPLFEGRICPVYANLEGSSTQLIALRTLADGEDRPFAPADTIYSNSTDYRLVRDAAGIPVSTNSNGALTYSYAPFSPENTATARVSYLDKDGAVVYEETVSGIPSGGTQAIAVPAVVKGTDGAYYRTITYTPTLIASNPGQRDFVVKCRKLDNLEPGTPKFYTATINLVDTQGTLLASDSVSVIGKQAYTAPLALYQQRDNQCIEYKLANKAQQTLRFDSATDSATGYSKSFDVVYEEQPADPASVEVTYNLIDATKGKKDAGRTIGTDIVKVDADNPKAFPPQDALMVSDEPYVLAGTPSMYEYDYNEGGIPEINVYYVPENYVAPGPYDVEVQYVNLADNSVIKTQTVQSSPDLQHDLAIETEAKFELDGSEYVRLDGQESPIEHNYYSSTRTYTVYYRNVNDDLTANTVVTRIRVVYEDTGTVTLADAGEGTGGATPLVLNPDGTYNAINGADGGLLTNEAGVDANTERIEDAENPLAAGSEETSPVEKYWPYAAIAVGVIAIAIIAIAIASRRKRHSEEEI